MVTLSLKKKKDEEEEKSYNSKTRLRMRTTPSKVKEDIAEREKLENQTKYAAGATYISSDAQKAREDRLARGREVTRAALLRSNSPEGRAARDQYLNDYSSETEIRDRALKQMMSMLPMMQSTPVSTTGNGRAATAARANGVIDTQARARLPLNEYTEAEKRLNQIDQETKSVGGIGALYQAQQKDAENDRDYAKKLSGVNTDNMTLASRTGSALWNTVKGTEKQWLGQMLSAVDSLLLPDSAASASAQKEGYESQREATRQAAWDYVTSLVGRRMGGMSESQAAESRSRLRNAIANDWFLNTQSYFDYVNNMPEGDFNDILTNSIADRLNAVADRIANGERGISADNILSYIPHGDLDKQAEELQGPIDRFRNMYGNLIESGQNDLQYAKYVNPLDEAGDWLVEAGSSALSSAQSAALSRAMFGGLISGVDTAANKLIDKLASAGLATTKVLSGTGFVADRLKDIIGMADFATNAYGGATYEARQKMVESGIDIGREEARKIRQYGAASTAIELGTEMMFSSIGAMRNASGKSMFPGFADTFGKWFSSYAESSTGAAALTRLGQLLGGGIEEGLEEVIGDILNDAFNTGGLIGDEEKTTFSEYMKDFFVGALSGWMGEASGQAYNIANRNQAGRAVLNGQAGINYQSLYDIASAMSENRQDANGAVLGLAQAYEQVERNGNGANASNAGRLYEAYSEYLDSTERGEETAEDIIQKAEYGKTLTNRQLNRVLQNDYAMQILEERTGADLQGETASDTRGNIRTALEGLASREKAIEMLGAQNSVELVEKPQNTPLRNIRNGGEDVYLRGIENAAREQAARVPMQLERNRIEAPYGSTTPADATMNWEERINYNRGRQALQTMQNFISVRDAAGRLGINEQGQETFAGMYDGKQEPVQYTGEMARFYNQGIENRDFDISELGKTSLTADQANAAYIAGRQDYLGKENTNERAEQAEQSGLRVRAGSEWNDGQNTGAESSEMAPGTGRAQTGEEGFVSGKSGIQRIRKESLNRESLSQIGLRDETDSRNPEIRAARDYAESHGLRFVAFSGGNLHFGGEKYGARGFYQPGRNGAPGTVYARTDHQMIKVGSIIRHEVTHAEIGSGRINIGSARGESTAVEFSTLRDALVRSLPGGVDEFNAMLDKYVEAYADTGESIEGIWEELVCDAVGGMNELLYQGHREDALKIAPTMQRVKDAAENMRAEGTRAGNMSEGKNSIDQNYSAEISEWHRLGMPANNRFILGSTGDVLQGLGAIENDIYIQGDKIKTILDDHPEMSIKEIQHIPDVLENPTLILKSRGANLRKGQQNTRLVVFGTLKARDGSPVLAALDLRPVENKFVIDGFQKVVSSYGRGGNATDFLNGSDVLYAANKEKTAKLLRTLGLQTRPSELLRSGFIGNIKYNGQNVNISGEPFANILRSSTGQNFDTALEELGDSGEYNSEAGGSFSREMNPDTLRKLNSGKTMTVYRAMQLIDGELYPPMSAEVKGKLVDPVEFDKWYVSDEHPEYIKRIDEKGVGHLTINKGLGKGSVDDVAYNPYWHTSQRMLNDQFSSAYDRPNLVTVECEIPASELTAGYKAQYAKDPVGATSWHAGPVATKMGKIGKPRIVYLSRWCKVKRIVPDAEVARNIASDLEGTNIPVPVNTVTPSLRNELEKIGVPITKARGLQKKQADAINATLADSASVAPGAYLPQTSTESPSRYNGTDGAYGIDQDGHKFSLDSMEKVDSEGNRLSENQADFFKDSKVRDEDGNLLVVYHGTDAEFTVFDRTKGRSTMDIQGSFFSPWDDDAEGYGPNVKAYYLNIKNPAPEGIAYKALNAHKGQNNAGVLAREDLERMGYDGVNNSGEEYIAFYPEQIKLVETQSPTDNPDIRFSKEFETPEELHAAAKPVQDRLNAMLREISNEFGFPYSDVTQKSLKSIKDKVERKVAAGKQYTIMDMKDHTRSCVTMSEWEDIPKVLDAFDDRGIPYETEAVVNDWGYKGFHTTWRNEDGITSEVQLTTKEHWALKLWSDAIYDKWRNADLKTLSLEERAEYLKDFRESREKWAQAGIPDLSIYERTSSAESGRAYQWSSKETGSTASVQTPLDNSRIFPPSKKGPKSNTRPSSVTQKSDIAVPPSSNNVGTNPNSSISDGENSVKQSRELRTSELYDQNRQLRKDLSELRQQLKQKTQSRDYWRGQTKVTEGRRLRADDVTRLAREVVKGQDSSADVASVSAKMKELGEYILNAQGTDDDLYGEARTRAYAIAHEILDQAKVLRETGGEDFYDDFKDYLKKTKIFVPGDIRSDVSNGEDWNAFKRSMKGINFGADGIGIDVAYKELQERFGEWLLPAASNKADMMKNIIRAYETYRPVYEHINSWDMADAVEYTANEIMTRIISDEIRETQPTYADRMEKKLADQKAKTQEALRRVRAQRDQTVASLKQHYQEVAQANRERKADSEARTRLLKIARRLNNKKLDRVSRALLNEYIGDLDLVAKGITGKSIRDLEALKEWYDHYKESMGDDFIPDKYIQTRLDRLSKRHISEMSQEEVADLTTVLLNFENMIRTENELIESQIRMDTYAAGERTIEDIRNSNGKTGFLNKYISTETATPEREIHRITGYREDDPMYMAAKELSDGQRKMLDYQRRAEKLFKAWTTDRKFTNTISGKRAKEVTVTGLVDGNLKEVRITPAMRMALYLHEKNDDNMTHISKGGIKIPDMGLYKDGKLQEAYDKGTIVVFTRGMLKEIASHMSQEERAFADAIYSYYNGMSRDSINEVSELLKGYSLAGVEKYYPIDTDGSFLKKEFDSLKRDGTLEGMGMLKERISGASNPIMLYDVNDTLSRSISQHSKYVGLAIPVRNFNRLYNVNSLGQKTSVSDALKQNWGSDATSYIEKMMSDIQNGTGLKPNVWGQMLARARSRYAGAVLTTNASVALKQAASYPTAAAVVGWKALNKALVNLRKYGDDTVSIDKLEDYTPLYWYRSKGFSTAELGDIGKEGGHIPKLLNWIQAIDMLTTRKLAKAAMYYVDESNKDLVHGSDTWYKEVAKVYNRIIEETQPNYTMMQRPQILRSDDSFVRALNMFKTQPFQNFNILYDAFGNLAAKSRQYKASATEENLQMLKEARKDAARAVSSQAVSAFIFGLMQFAWDLFRGKTKKYKDDDDEMTFASWLKGMGINVLSSVGGMIPFGSFALELGEAMTDSIYKSFGGGAIFDQTFYGLSENAAESFNDMGQALISLVAKTADVMSGSELNETKIRGIIDSAADIAQFAGIPASNVIKTTQSIARIVFLTTDGKWVGGYKALRVTTDPAKYSSDYYALLYKAYKQEQAAYEKILGMMLEDSSNVFTEEKVKNAMEKRMKADQGVEKVSDLETRWMTPTQQTVYDQGLNSMQRTSIWAQASDEQQQKVLSTLYNIAVENSTGQKLNEKIEGGSSVGLDQNEYLLYQLALQMADEDQNGSYKMSETETAIRMIPGLTDRERAYLFEQQHPTAKKNPWK